MLKVQIMSGTVEVDLMNGSSHSRYHGYITGAHKSDAAIGQANASGDPSVDFLLIQIAVRKPTSTASPATTCRAVTRSSVAKKGSLHRNPPPYLPPHPIRIRPLLP